MIVLDASVVVDLVLATPGAVDRIASRLFRDRTLAAPHLLDIEVAQVVRRFVRAGRVGAERAAEALQDLAVMPVIRYAHGPLLARVFALRDNVTAYDAAYLALAEDLDAPLLTRDEALSEVPGCHATVEVI